MWDKLNKKYALSAEEDAVYAKVWRKRAYCDLVSALAKYEITPTVEQVEEILDEYRRRRYSDWAVADESEDMLDSIQEVMEND